jgi:hypothetical protein
MTVQRWLINPTKCYGFDRTKIVKWPYKVVEMTLQKVINWPYKGRSNNPTKVVMTLQRS